MPVEENQQKNPIVVNEVYIDKVIKSVIVLLLVISVLVVHYYGKPEPEQSGYLETINHVENKHTLDSDTEIELNKTEAVKKPVIVTQPACQKSYMLVILQEICTDLVLKKENCSPEDFFNESKHKIPKSRPKRTKKNKQGSMIMNYMIGGLLIISLGAALIELYKVKKQSPKRNGKSISRKCSLADLTVMKHQRKELIRRDSIMEVPEENQHIKQMGSVNTPPRRCSLPVEQNQSCNFKFPSSNNGETTRVVVQITSNERRISLSDYRLSASEKRISMDYTDYYRVSPFDSKRHSMDESKEKRRHRLLHRY